MYRPILLVLTTTVFLSLQACNSGQQSKNQAADSTRSTAESSTPNSSALAITGRLAGLGLTTDSDWRGINLGDDFAKVKTTEKGEAFENDAKHVGYTVEFPTLETADMLYYQTNQKVSAIDVDLFLNNQQSVNDYQKELTPYFTARYGASKPSNGGLVWTSPEGKTVTMKDVSKKKDFGLKIKITSTGGATTASVK